MGCMLELVQQRVGHAHAAGPPLEEQQPLRVRVARAAGALAAEVGRLARHAERREADGEVLDGVQPAARVRAAGRVQRVPQRRRQLEPHAARVVVVPVLRVRVVELEQLRVAAVAHSGRGGTSHTHGVHARGPCT